MSDNDRWIFGGLTLAHEHARGVAQFGKYGNIYPFRPSCPIVKHLRALGSDLSAREVKKYTPPLEVRLPKYLYPLWGFSVLNSRSQILLNCRFFYCIVSNLTYEIAVKSY